MLEPLTEKYRWEMHVTIYDSDVSFHKNVENEQLLQ